MIHQGSANQSMNNPRMGQSANEGMGGHMYVWMGERSCLFTKQRINQRARAPTDGPSTESPIGSIDERVGEWSSQFGAIQYNTIQRNII